ncbi:uncharacterized protein [Dysidea avara]|uniref:uncharacterized protein n=1 Tax=Dysidea avara TaxID=196820 RepID=UPI00332C93CA
MNSVKNSRESSDSTLLSTWSQIVSSHSSVDHASDASETTESSAMRRLEAEGDVCGFDHDVAGGDGRYYDAEDNVWSLDDSSVAVGDRILDAESNIPGFVNQDHSVMEDETMLSNDAEGYAQSLMCHTGKDHKLLDVEGNVLAKPKGVMELEYDSQLLGTENHIEGCNNVEGKPDDILDTGILLLAECDVPGSSLDGKHPSELNVMKLKRWLVCRGAPTNGKKPELIERVCDFIKYGWDLYLIDPDDGINVKNKLQAVSAKHRHFLDENLLQSVPKAKDNQWTKDIHKCPKITFGTIFKFLVDRKCFLRNADYVESAMERRDSCSVKDVGEQKLISNLGSEESIGFTRPLDKAYRFFQDGHVQNIRYHPMPNQLNYICIGADVLPSMKKDKLYKVYIVLSELTSDVAKAFCACPAGLSGCCNHVTATLYCLQNYFHLKLNEEDEKSCTEKRQLWNQPRDKKVDARPTNLVTLTKKVYGVEKRIKVCTVNQWDCRPTSRRAVPPDRRPNLRSRLLAIDQKKKEVAVHAVASATNVAETKKAIEAQTMLSRYGTSCFLQLLDDEPAPSEDRLQRAREERISKAKAMKSKFQQELCNLVDIINHDHCYSSSTNTAVPYEVDNSEVPPPSYLVRNLYEDHICIGPSRAIDIEASTRNQSISNVWHDERMLRISASIMKTVCHRKKDTDAKTFITNKLAQKSINSPAIN